MKLYINIYIHTHMSLKLSFPEKTNLYLTNLNIKSKIDVLIPDGVLICDESNEDLLYSLIPFINFIM